MTHTIMIDSGDLLGQFGLSRSFLGGFTGSWVILKSLLLGSLTSDGSYLQRTVNSVKYTTDEPLH